MKIRKMTCGKKNKSVYAFAKAALIGFVLLFALTGLFGCAAPGRSSGTGENTAAATTKADEAIRSVAAVTEVSALTAGPGTIEETGETGEADENDAVSEAVETDTAVAETTESSVQHSGVENVADDDNVGEGVGIATTDVAKEGSGGTTTEVVAEESSAVQSVQTEASQTQAIDPNTGKDKYRTDVVPEGKPVPIEPEDMNLTDVARSCTLSISCETLLNDAAKLSPEKIELVPEDGFILQPVTVTFYDGESVFNVLQREMKKNRIHMEFVSTAIFNSAYIEGIGNIYEFDSGELSGWMYKVNGWFPNYGCSRYQLEEGDVIEWVYTCNLGRDIGGADNAAGQMGLR